MVEPIFPRLHVVTASLPVVEAVLSVSPRVAIQVRVDDALTDRDAYALTVAALARCRERGAMCLVNDRLDVAVAAGADGAHVGADDLPPAAARKVLGPSAVLGVTLRAPAVVPEASYFGVGPAFATSTKDGLPDPIGPPGVGAVAEAATIPVIAIAGVTPSRVPSLLAVGAYGVAAVGAIARDPVGATREFLEALS
ncbi:thiamine phosphate synthase [Actinoplanes sp. NPDC049265]|uniref:thiamine phosphate synthase n=1 Tax=Actinoplanes sp. NPDC049265 TaxID=3363902 RepID=UPI003719B7ED